MAYWISKAEHSSNSKVVRQYVGPKEYKSSNVMYTAKADSAIWADFCDDHPNLRQYVSRSVFMGAKPFYLRPHKWLTCKCPLCHEMFRLPGKTVKPRCWTPPVPELVPMSTQTTFRCPPELMSAQMSALGGRLMSALLKN